MLNGVPHKKRTQGGQKQKFDDMVKEEHLNKEKKGPRSRGGRANRIHGKNPDRKNGTVSPLNRR